MAVETFATILVMLSTVLSQFTEDGECPVDGRKFGESCYVYNGKAASFDLARRDCHKTGGQLLTISDPQEADFVLRYTLYMTSFLYRIYYCGSNANIEHGSLENSYLVNPHWESFGNKSLSEPCNKTLLVGDIAHYADMEVLMKYQYICQFNRSELYDNKTCSGNSCYQLSWDGKTLMDAEDHCRRNGGELTRVTSSKQLQFLLQHIVQEKNLIWSIHDTAQLTATIDIAISWGGVWVGVTYDPEEHTWISVDNSSVIDTVKGIDIPESQDHRVCVIMLLSRMWPYPCHFTVTSICEHKVIRNYIFGIREFSSAETVGITIGSMLFIASVVASMIYINKRIKKLKEDLRVVLPRGLNTDNYDEYQCFKSRILNREHSHCSTLTKLIRDYNHNLEEGTVKVEEIIDSSQDLEILQLGVTFPSHILLTVQPNEEVVTGESPYTLLEEIIGNPHIYIKASDSPGYKQHFELPQLAYVTL